MSTGAFESVQSTGGQQDPHVSGAHFDERVGVETQPAAWSVEAARAMEGGTLVQHYPRMSDGRVHVQLGRQFAEEGVAIDWPESSYKRRVYLQTKTGDKYLIVGNTFHDLSASEAAGEPVYYQLDPDVPLPDDLVGNPLEYLPDHKTDVIEMVEISAGFSDSQGEHLDAYEMAGADPFEKFNRRFEQVRDGQQRAAHEQLLNDGVLLDDFRTYPNAESRGLRARARGMIAKAGLAGKTLMAEARDQIKPAEHEWKYTRRKAVLAVAIGAVAFVGGLGLDANGLSRGSLTRAKPTETRQAALRSALKPNRQTVIPRPGDNPWVISRRQLVSHGVAHPSGPEVADYDQRFLQRNFPHVSNLGQIARYIEPNRQYVLPNFNSKKPGQ